MLLNNIDEEWWAHMYWYVTCAFTKRALSKHYFDFQEQKGKSVTRWSKTIMPMVLAFNMQNNGENLQSTCGTKKLLLHPFFSSNCAWQLALTFPCKSIEINGNFCWNSRLICQIIVKISNQRAILRKLELYTYFLFWSLKKLLKDDGEPTVSWVAPSGSATACWEISLTLCSWINHHAVH